MGMNSIESTARRLLVDQWNNVKAQLDRLSLPDAKPNDGYQIFSLIEDPKVDGQIGFDIKPVTFNVPERADASPNMFIVAQGRIYLDQTMVKSNTLKTVSFATEVGYFRMSKGELHHVYGAHYDFSFDEIGHPIFHGQMRSYNERASWISDAFKLDCGSKDHMAGILRTVRLPTAQMDFFSLILQICADHLISKDSGDDQKKAFENLRDASSAIQGAGHRWETLVQAPRCMRSQHWYR